MTIGIIDFFEKIDVADHQRERRARKTDLLGDDAGLAVPGDVSVVGFDDIQSAAYSTPSLTTVRQPLMEMGKRGAQVLLERIANRSKEYPSEIVMAPDLVIRESTGAAAAKRYG